MKRLGEFLLKSDANAIIVAFVFSLLSLYLPTGFFAAIIVALITLHSGAKKGAVVLVWVALPAIAMLVLKRVGPFDVFLLRCFATWAFAALLNKYGSWALVLEVGVVIAAVVVLILHFAFPDIHNWWVTQLSNIMSNIANESAEMKSAVTSLSAAKKMAPIATGLLVFMFLAGTIIQLAVARWWSYLLKKQTKKPVFAREFAEIRIGALLSICAVATFLMASFKFPAFIDLLPVMLFPFFIGGLSLLHWLTLGKPKAVPIMVLIYVGIIFLPQYVIFTLAVVGFFDSWGDFRKRVNYS